MSVAVLVQTSCVSSVNEEDIVNQRITLMRSADYIFILKEVLGGIGGVGSRAGANKPCFKSQRGRDC